MELRQLRTFRIVATSGSFTQAAVVLNYAQSSVTAQIQALEKELGVMLFDRLGRNIQTTEAGKQLLAYANQILDLTDEAKTAISGKKAPASMISIGAPESICTYRLPAILRNFRQDHPGIQLSFRPMLDVDLYYGIRNGALDVAFLLQEPLQSEGIQAESLVCEPLLVIAAAGHRLAAYDRVGPKDLEGETVLLTESGCGYRHLFEQEVTRAGMYSVVKLEFNSVEAIKQCVIAGLGIGFLPQVAVQKEIAQGQICPPRWEKTFTVYTQMIHNKEKWRSLAMDEFMQLSRCLLAEPAAERA